MKIKKPIFYLNKLFPTCGQGSSLIFCSCPTCKKIILVCDEEGPGGSIFPDPQKLEMIATNQSCPQCGQVEITDFLTSTSAEIYSLGFKHGEFK